MILIYISIIAIFALIFSLIKYLEVINKDAGTKRMQEISKAIHEGAITFLNKEYKVLFLFVIFITVILNYFISTKISIAFLLGSILSALAGNIGMRAATKANARTAQATKKSLDKGLKVAFSSGTVMGMCVVSLGVLGITVLYYFFEDPKVIYGFGFGASFIALFARVAGGIFTKAADVGADLVGKIEKKIPEDDPRNPAVIADNVGDNVGDVAGMGADLFESYVDSIIAAMVIGLIVLEEKGALLPLMLAAGGIIASIIGTLFVKVRKGEIYMALDKGIFNSTIFMAIISYFIIKIFLDDMAIFYPILLGLGAAIIIGLFTEYITSPYSKPTKGIAESSQTSAATNIINGISVGMLSTIVPILTISCVILISYMFAGLYGIAISAVGMLSILGITLATDAYGSVADNAAGIAEMAHMGKSVREKTEKLDEVGNTTAATGKGFAIGSAALTSLALFVSYLKVTNLSVISLSDPRVIVGLFIGAALPFLFSALTMKAVGHAASEIIQEVRRQFKTIKGLIKGKAKPDYNKCIEISTNAALKEMILPGLLAILSPIIIGLFLGPEALGGLLAGAISTGFLLAIFMANSGGAWDNAKKYIEQGHLGGKGSFAHQAAVVGDTVGDPFKDCSGPSLNILIKLMTIVALVFVPLFL